MKFNIRGLAKAFKNTLVKNADDILIGFGVGGIFITAFFAGRDTLKAKEKIDEVKKEEKVERLDKKKIVKTVWKCYIPTAVSATATAACILSGRRIKAKRYAALMTAYSLTDKAYTEYKEAALETVGKKKEKDIQDTVAKNEILKDPNVNKDVIITGKGMSLCYDAAFGRYFYSDYEKIRQSVNNLNFRLRTEMYISLNDFYYELGLPAVDMGNKLGWNINVSQIEIAYSSQLTENGTPCLVMNYLVAPMYDFASS